VCRVGGKERIYPFPSHMAKVELENLSEKGYEEYSERGFGQYKEGKLGRKAPFRLPLRLSGGPVRGFAAQFQKMNCSHWKMSLLARVC
jgi:hypothetical protein